ncbi:peptide-methionine (S)-S-oxide reductase MsrA [Paracoccus sp. p4-l81]|uniref:peptide-methionine (S)-S-oxide reductase MsrA n=1 Tax=unclassified Paracoccus (in: a-proteobacteria) TaxID=2688777 RepID=UPI0035BAC119
MTTGPFADRLPTADEALPGRDAPIMVPGRHAVLGTDIGELPAGHEVVLLGMGCYWGAERLLWQAEGVHSTAVGFAGGLTPNPTYAEVCTGRTGHAEVVRVVFDPARISLSHLLQLFWDNHDPTQGNRQGNDRGTQYRSAIYAMNDHHLALAEASAVDFGNRLAVGGFGAITTEIAPMPVFYFAEDEHQQYLHKNPNGYCGLKGTGVKASTSQSL